MPIHDEKLYDQLAKLRLQLARQADQPAFVVFSNRTLRRIAEVRPGTKDTFLKIHGVGPGKWEKYGQLFLDVIIRYCTETGAGHDIALKDERVVQDLQLAELLEKIYDFFEQRDWQQYHSPKNLVMNLASEIGELVEPFRWLTEVKSYHLDANTLEEVSDEIGDVFMSLIYLANRLGIDPIKASHEKLLKQAEKYPVDACRGKALKYTAYQKP